MTTNDVALLRTLLVAVPPLAATAIAAAQKNARAFAFGAAVVCAAGSGALVLTAPPGESLAPAVMLLYSLLAAGVAALIPRRDCTPWAMASVLLVLGGTLAAYAADNLAVLAAGWVVSTIPFLRPKTPRVLLSLSSVALIAAVGAIAASGSTLRLQELRGDSPGGTAVFSLLVLAAALRKGIWPAHIWVRDAVDEDSPVVVAFFFNGHLGALLAAKVILPLFPVPAQTFTLISYLALGTAVLLAIRALTENAPRRLLAFIALSQSACILAGLESQTAEGMTGALVHWCVVSVSTVAMFGILRLLEVRFGENLWASSYRGLAENAPRLAVYFLVFGLALVGLPGTLSFCSQELLIHGTLATHPYTGLLLPAATAMNAIGIFRLFTRLFLGKRRTGFTITADALPRERWMLAAGVLFVVLGGLFPRAIVAMQTAQVETVTRQAVGE